MALILPNTVTDHAAELAEKIRLLIEKGEIKTEKETLKITASFGVADLSATTEASTTHLINAADNALYEAKNKGRNRVEKAAAITEVKA